MTGPVKETEVNWERQRAGMVEDQLRGRGIHDERVLEAMGSVPRHEFVPRPQRCLSYQDCALPLAEGQTISQPWIVAYTCQLLELKGDERVLDVGTGSGYAAAVLSLLAAEVFTIEVRERLAQRARDRLERLGYGAIRVVVGDGSRGLPDEAPFDAIAVAATSRDRPAALIDQLAPAGSLVCPVAGRGYDWLKRYRRLNGEIVEEEETVRCRFVPLVSRDRR